MYTSIFVPFAYIGLACRVYTDREWLSKRKQERQNESIRKMVRAYYKQSIIIFIYIYIIVVTLLPSPTLILQQTVRRFSSFSHAFPHPLSHYLYIHVVYFQSASQKYPVYTMYIYIRPSRRQMLFTSTENTNESPDNVVQERILITIIILYWFCP